MGLARVELRPRPQHYAVPLHLGECRPPDLRLSLVCTRRSEAACHLRATSTRERLRKMALQRCRRSLVGLRRPIRVTLHCHACRRVPCSPLRDVVGHARVCHRRYGDVAQGVERQPRRDCGPRPAGLHVLRSDAIGGRAQNALDEPTPKDSSSGPDKHEQVRVGIGAPTVQGKVSGQLANEERWCCQRPKALLRLSFGLKGQVPGKLLDCSGDNRPAAGSRCRAPVARWLRPNATRAPHPSRRAPGSGWEERRPDRRVLPG